MRGGGPFEGLYKFVMRRNSVYVTFVVAGAFLGERAVDYGVHKLWEYNNVGENGQGNETEKTNTASERETIRGHFSAGHKAGRRMII
ncbi:hypothetical protein QJS10_CPA08g01481 [Acorus calamus]|uniref:Complex III subunit 9 n=1 Tax=Acorus calamus TaxID=4465 RepID=A0AAV9ECL0_ACOCL|nr:hypothetical protein QJS10_CPA08g01481 [Acorus calamus]